MTMAVPDSQLHQKKRARRRLVGAVAFAGLAAIVLPMVMDQAPPAPISEVQIRIPGQDQVPPFNPKTLADRPPEADKPPVAALPELAPPAAAVKAPEPAAKLAEAPAAKAPEKAAEKTVEKAAEKAPAKSAETPEKQKPAPAPEKPAKPAPAAGAAPETQRAAAILAGKTAGTPAASGQYVILIGAFANTANVKQLQHKLGELNVKTYTEALDTPQGRKTRVRAGPFANRDLADKALDKMKRIGVTGVVAAKP